jgi:hypothetical protein
MFFPNATTGARSHCWVATLTHAGCRDHDARRDQRCRQDRTRDCMALMSSSNIRHLPRLNGSIVPGMISIRDIMDDIIAADETRRRSRT